MNILSSFPSSLELLNFSCSLEKKVFTSAGAARAPEAQGLALQLSKCTKYDSLPAQSPCVPALYKMLLHKFSSQNHLAIIHSSLFLLFCFFISGLLCNTMAVANHVQILDKHRNTGVSIQIPEGFWSGIAAADRRTIVCKTDLVETKIRTCNASNKALG